MAIRFRSYVSAATEVDPCLPLIHTTSTNAFRNVLSTGEIKALKKCPVFGEYLTYFFYGRPAFKVEIENPEQRIIDDYLPAALVLKASAISRVKRIYPFDSGAFAGEYYRGAHHADAKLEDYLLDPTINSAKKVVGAFFETNSRYFFGDCIKTCTVNPFDAPEVHAHFELISGSTGVEVDDRRYTIEVQTEEEIDLSSSLLAFVIPHAWLASESVQDFLRLHPSVLPLSYSRYVGMSIQSSHGAMFERIHDYLVSEGMT
ncbi:hypothetical protein ACJMQP_27975 [Rhodopseudomonas palustris]